MRPTIRSAADVPKHYISSKSLLVGATSLSENSISIHTLNSSKIHCRHHGLKSDSDTQLCPRAMIILYEKANACAAETAHDGRRF